MFETSKEKYKNSEYKILIAKMADQYEFAKKRNKITTTDFLNISERAILEKILKEEQVLNFVFYGGKENADRSILVFYPEKFSMQMVEKNYPRLLKIIRIVLPKDIHYEHREYLSGIMKLGMKREKFGDIIVTEQGADIIVLEEVSEYLMNGLKELTRFRKAQITIESILDVTEKETEFEKINIIVSSLRLDNFVSELAKCSRTKAEEMIREGRVFINSIQEFKDSKKINISDLITIRGKGKYIFDEVERETRSSRFLVNMRKYK